MENLRKCYYLGDQELEILHGINLVINRGEFISIMGPSGSGKSTLMNIIGFLDRPTSGLYELNGQDVSSLDDDKEAFIRNQTIGFIFQSFNLLSRYSAYENVALPLMYRDEEIDYRTVDQAFEVVGLSDRKNHKPNELSGGQRQRVAIARALVTNPPILLADEPTGNLDSKTSVEIMEFFKTLHERGSTIILVTHEIETAEYADRIISIRDGIIHESKNDKIRGKAKLHVEKTSKK